MGLGISGLRLGLHARKAGGFNPSSLFPAAGLWFDVSDLSTMFTDTSGTTPAAVDDAVARINDKSGNGYHATQSTEGKRPILRESGGLYYLDFDGTDDGMATGNVDLTGADAVSVFLGALKEGSASRGTVVEQGNNEANTFLIDAPVGAEGVAAPFRFVSRGSGIGEAFAENAATQYYAPFAGVITGQGDISADSVALRINGVEVDTGSTDQGTGNFSNKPIYLGARGATSNYFNGRVYGLIILNSLADAGTVASAEEWMAAKSGVSL